MKALLAQKIGMMSVITDQGRFRALTLLSAPANTITQLKTKNRDGYWAVQLGLGEAKRTSKPQQGHFKSAKLKTGPRFCREIRLTSQPVDLEVGQTVGVDQFQLQDRVVVTAKSKGKGFAGGIKRHHFHRGPKTHGGKGVVRKIGSVGNMGWTRVTKGKKMPGQMGNQTITQANLEVGLIDPEQQLIGLIGSVPGPKKGLVIIKA